MAGEAPGERPGGSAPVGPAAPAHCDGCGRPTAECAGCRWEYDPPRFCPTCGLRLAVVVSPAGHRSRCKVHGEVAVGGTGGMGDPGHR